MSTAKDAKLNNTRNTEVVKEPQDGVTYSLEISYTVLRKPASRVSTALPGSEYLFITGRQYGRALPPPLPSCSVHTPALAVVNGSLQLALVVGLCAGEGSGDARSLPSCKPPHDSSAVGPRPEILQATQAMSPSAGDDRCLPSAGEPRVGAESQWAIVRDRDAAPHSPLSWRLIALSYGQQALSAHSIRVSSMPWVPSAAGQRLKLFSPRRRSRRRSLSSPCGQR